MNVLNEEPGIEVAVQFAGGAQRLVRVKALAFEVGLRVTREDRTSFVGATRSDLRDPGGRPVYVAVWETEASDE